MHMTPELETFRAWTSTLSDLDAVASVLSWDRAVSMPVSGAESRSHQLETLAALAHRELTRPEIGDVLESIGGDPGVDAATRREAELLGRERRRALRLPEGLVRAISAAESATFAAWSATRDCGDWEGLRRPLTRLVELKRSEAQAISDGPTAYDGLLDVYEPGATYHTLAPAFDALAIRLAPLVAAGTAHHSAPLPSRHWPHRQQLQLASDIAGLIGFDLAEGRIGESAHPFTGTLGDGDVRFSTRIDERNPISNILTVLHEAGHAMYEQGFSADFRRSPLRDAPSLGAHEAQARFWENHVGGTLEFWQLIEPRMQDLFPDAMRGLSATRLHQSATAIRRSPIRVDADEVTYNLHIILRFEIEAALIGGTLAVADLPEAWNARTRELLEFTPESPSVGVMQDVHWMEGLFGYFPTYTLGNIYAAQLAETVDVVVGGLPDAIARRGFQYIVEVLRDRTYRFGAMVPTTQLMEQATGVPFGPEALVSHLERRVMAGAGATLVR
jgi:carboxypeptidase Taq